VSYHTRAVKQLILLKVKMIAMKIYLNPGESLLEGPEIKKPQYEYCGFGKIIIY